MFFLLEFEVRLFGGIGGSVGFSAVGRVDLLTASLSSMVSRADGGTSGPRRRRGLQDVTRTPVARSSVRGRGRGISQADGAVVVPRCQRGLQDVTRTPNVDVQGVGVGVDVGAGAGAVVPTMLQTGLVPLLLNLLMVIPGLMALLLILLKCTILF